MNRAEARFTAIQHYLVRPFRPKDPLLHGLFGAKGTEKTLSYTTLVDCILVNKARRACMLCYWPYGHY